MKILIVDDEPVLLEQLRSTLAAERYDVETATDGETALARLLEVPFDLVLLDIMLPGLDGLALLREMRRAEIVTPVLMLSARGEIADRIRGLDLGADDYLAKPFAMAELLARIRALLRRAGESCETVLTVADLSLDTVTRQVRRHGEPVELTPKEFAILEFLLYSKNRVVSRYSLAEHVWGDSFDLFTMSNFIDVHLKNLRRKIGDTDQRLIRTRRGVGYIIEEHEA